MSQVEEVSPEEAIEDMTRAERDAYEDGVELAAKMQAEQEARDDDDPLVLQKRPAEGEEDDEAAEPADEGEYAGKSKEELEDELEERGLAKSGNKADLIARLQADDAENA